ncbi:hypothetical protein GQ53DRAFT_820576 [Thozetella sp. PMI_491]|nr:hypothetical protein GQ53DRAFT_820576 [Thozetella sp. PMI_491]
MGSGSRPAPLSIGPFRSNTTPLSASPKSADSATRSFSTDDMSFPPTFHSRKSSSGSASSTSSSGLDKKSSKKPTSPTVNAHSYCGRHTDQFLFGGNSPFTDLWKAVRGKD